MTELLEKAFGRARALSEETQDELARVVLRLAGDDDAAYVLSAAEEADLIVADEEVARGDMATDADVEAVFAKFRS